MKIKNVFACLLFAYVPFTGLWSADNPDAAKPRIDLKREFKTRVETNQFGDVFIARLPMPDSSKLKNTDIIGPSMLALISYIDQDLDFEKLDESLNKATGAVDKKGDRKDSVPIDGLIAGANRYLASKNMGLQKVGFTANNFRQRIEDGVPIGWLFPASMTENLPPARRRGVPQNLPMIGLSRCESSKRRRSPIRAAGFFLRRCFWASTKRRTNISLRGAPRSPYGLRNAS